MKLAACYNAWDGVELLRGSMLCLKDHVDLFIIVYQDVSNFGEFYDPLPEIDLTGFNVILYKYTPTVKAGHVNEIAKRNKGIEIAKENGCTHFINLDCDEYYKDFGAAKQEFINSGKGGSVCKLYTYFKEPIYRLENLDNYFVPFIHELKSDTVSGVRQYPFYVDPTRRINETDVIQLSEPMHHFSYVRKDIERKVRNSSAKVNLEKGTHLQDYYYLPENPDGFFVKSMGQKIKLVDNYFGLNLSE